MARITNWSDEQVKILRDRYPSIDNPRLLVEVLNKSYKAIKTKAKLLKIKRQFKAIGKPSDSSYDQIIKNEYLTTPVKALAKKIDKSYTFVSYRIEVLGLVIPPELIEQRKQIGRFNPGIIPQNKGKKMPMEYRLKCEQSWFKRGHTPHNAKDKDGYISIRKDTKTGIQYKYIRLSLSVWVPYHRWLWEQEKGPIPPKHVIMFKNGDTLDCRIENLEMITLKENMKRNSFINYPDEIREVINLRSQLTRKINKKSKNIEDEK